MNSLAPSPSRSFGSCLSCIVTRNSKQYCMVCDTANNTCEPSSWRLAWPGYSLQVFIPQRTLQDVAKNLTKQVRFQMLMNILATSSCCVCIHDHHAQQRVCRHEDAQCIATLLASCVSLQTKTSKQRSEYQYAQATFLLAAAHRSVCTQTWGMLLIVLINITKW